MHNCSHGDHEQGAVWGWVAAAGYRTTDGGGCGGGGLREPGTGCGLGIMSGSWRLNGASCDSFKTTNEIKSLFTKYIDYL